MNEQQNTNKQHATELKLHGLIAHWQDITDDQHPLLAQWLTWELAERKQRSLERRLNSAKLGRFKPLTEFDWQWPSKIDQATLQRLMQLDHRAKPRLQSSYARTHHIIYHRRKYAQ